MKPVRLWLSAMIVGAAAAVSSCGDRTTTGPAPGPGALQASVGDVVRHNRHPVRSLAKNADELVKCRPQSPDLVIQRIGPAGGVIAVGRYTLTIPPGALEKRVMIAARIPSGEFVNLVEFKPDGLIFRQPASLAMTYTNCDRQGSTRALQVAVVDDGREVLYYLPSVDDPATQTVTGVVQHFTNYAVAW